MQIPIPPLLAVATSSILSLTAFADTLLLKDGTSLEGKVLREEADHYVVEVQYSASIRDERKIPKTSVTKIQRDQGDMKPYQELKRLVPVPELWTAADYDKLLDQKFDAFLKKHGTSRYYREVRDMRKALVEERNAIAAGGIKLNGRIISASDRQADAVDIDAAAALKTMSDAANAGDFLAALRTFTQIEADFAGTTAHADATELAKKVLVSFRANLNAELAALPEKLRQREAGLERMVDDQRARAKEAFALQQKALEAKIANEKKNQVKWSTINPDRKESIEETLRAIDAERTKLQTPAANPNPRSPGVAYREAWQKLGSAKPEEAKAILDDFKTLTVPAKYLAMLEQRAAATSPSPSPSP